MVLTRAMNWQQWWCLMCGSAKTGFDLTSYTVCDIPAMTKWSETSCVLNSTWRYVSYIVQSSKVRQYDCRCPTHHGRQVGSRTREMFRTRLDRVLTDRGEWRHRQWRRRSRVIDILIRALPCRHAPRDRWTEETPLTNTCCDASRHEKWSPAAAT